MNVSAIRDRLKTLLDGVDGVAGYDTVPGSPTPPSGGVAAIVTPGEPFVSYPTMDRDCADVLFVITCVTGRADERAAQDNLDSFLNNSGDDSIRAALEVDASEWDFCSVETIRRYGAFTFGAGEAAVVYLGCQLAATVGVS